MALAFTNYHRCHSPFIFSASVTEDLFHRALCATSEAQCPEEEKREY
jgi:hypothetical protein